MGDWLIRVHVENFFWDCRSKLYARRNLNVELDLCGLVGWSKNGHDWCGSANRQIATAFAGIRLLQHQGRHEISCGETLGKKDDNEL